MPAVHSEMIPLGTPAPAFDLPAANPGADEAGGERRRLEDYAGARVLVVVFTCNHCPYAQAVEERLIRAALDYTPRGVRFVLVNPNDPAAYPEDSFEHMQRRAAEKRYPFPYLFDESQAVARAYGAACTPDLFVFDAERLLRYRGRLDDGRPGAPQVTRHDLRDALDELLETGRVTVEQIPSIGCSIKWRK